MNLIHLLRRWRTRATIRGIGGAFLASLPTAEREVLLLAAADGLSLRDIAVLTGLAPADVEELLAKALLSLSRAIDAEEGRAVAPPSLPR